jgi:membrane protein
LQDRIMAALSDLLPGSAGIVRNTIETVLRHRGSMGWIGVVGILWSASKGFGAVARVVNRALDTEREPFFLLAWARRMFMTVAVTILIVASMGLIVAIEIELKTTLSGVDIPYLPSRIVPFVLIFLNFALIYRLAPYVKVQWRQVMPGALLAALLF